MAQLVASRRGTAASQHDFSTIPGADIPRSVFNRSCGLKTAFDSGYLVPVFVDEVLPGDTFKLQCQSFVRLTTPIFPVMDNIYQDFFFFFVPYRLIWSNWERFNGAQDDPGDPVDFEPPQMTETVAAESLSDFMGIPIAVTGITGAVTFNSFAHRAYNLIWNDWFRDENLQDSVVVDVDDGPDTSGDYVLLRRGKRHDYFSSCLPFPQKGDPVLLPLGTSAPLSSASAPIAITGVPTFTKGSGAGTIGAAAGLVAVSGAANADVRILTSATGGDVNLTWAVPGLETTLTGITADLSGATSATINEIREAFQIQRLLERDARGGTRYTEIVRSHFGVISDDARLQRAEYLGGGSTRVNIHPVARTTASANTASLPPVSNLGGFGVATGSAGFLRSFTEHGVVIGLVNVRADLHYQQGLERMFSRRSRFEFYWPSLAHLGEQAVLNKEIYMQGSVDAAADELTFGYQERYAEYRYKPSKITGVMRSTNVLTMDPWHLAQEFGSLPLLNDTFIQDDPPFDRVLTVITGQPQFFGDFWFEYRCARPMPTFGVPGMIDHF